MQVEDYKAIIEGLLFATGDEGLTMRKLSQLLDLEQFEVQVLIDELYEDYRKRERGLMIMDSKGTLHLTTKPEHASFYKQLLDQSTSSRLSQAALETLAIVAYKQPITRIEIDDLRGVKSDRAVQTLMTRGLIEEKGRKEAVGRPVLFGTTVEFLTYFGLQSITELPPLSEVIGTEDVEGEADLFFEKFSELDEM